MTPRLAVLNPEPKNRYQIDHTAVMSTILQAPLLVTDDDSYEMAQRYYPGVDVRYTLWRDIAPGQLMQAYDALVYSYFWSQSDFHAAFAQFDPNYRQHMRAIWMPHGWSDKGLNLHDHFELLSQEDIILTYGERMLTLMRRTPAEKCLDRCIRTGQYRLDYYRKHQAFFDAIAEQELFARFAKPQKTIFYAPTMQSPESASAINHTTKYVLDALPAEFNLIVKLHPYVKNYFPGTFLLFQEHYANRPNLIILDEFPLVMPLLQHCDLYLGDFSSVGYDCLAFEKPMFFLNPELEIPEDDPTFFLFQCGRWISKADYPRLYQIIQEELPLDTQRFKGVRQKVYADVFASNCSFESIRQQVLEACKRFV